MLSLRPTRLLAVCSATALLLAGCAGAPEQPPKQPSAAAQPPAGCLDEQAIAQWIAAYTAKERLTDPPENLSDADAACTRAAFQQKLSETEGPLAGYKVALTNPKVQKSFNATQPIWGALYQNMLLPNRSKVSVKYGTWPVLDASVLVRIKSSEINQASSPEQALAHIDQIAPFIELADVLVQTPSKLTPQGMTAINAGARLGVVGVALPVPADAAKQKRLLREIDNMTVRVQTGKGKLLSQGKGSDAAGHPLQAVLWLAAALREQGQALQPGQWVSLGTFSSMLRPQAGQTVTVVYPGLTGVRPVEVTFQ